MFDFTKASETRFLKTGVSVPPACLQGDLYFLLSAPAGANVFACVASQRLVGARGAKVAFRGEQRRGRSVNRRQIFSMGDFWRGYCCAPGSAVFDGAPQSDQALVWNERQPGLGSRRP
jgi:hypothetical protein